MFMELLGIWLVIDVKEARHIVVFCKINLCFIPSDWSRGHHVGCLNGWYNTSKKCLNMAWQASLYLCLYDSFFTPIGRERRLCHVTRYAWRAHQSTYKELFTKGPHIFIAEGVFCWKKSLNNYNFCFLFFGGTKKC